MSFIVSVDLAGHTDNGWRYHVSIEGYHYSVTLSRDYFKKVVSSEIGPDELVKKSFDFLLQREPPSAILQQFDLQDINKFFPEYEQSIKSM